MTSPKPRAGIEADGAAALASALRRDAPLSAELLRGLLDGLRVDGPPAIWHPTGFMVIVVHRGRAGALRLHVWPAGAREQGRPCWPVHDHVWHLRSQVLCGVVHSRHYAVVDDPAGDGRLYAVEYARANRSYMRRSPRSVRVVGQRSRRVEAGARYTVEAGEFHASSVAPGRLAATLVATTPTARRRPWVVGPSDGPDRVSVERPVAEPRRVRSLLDRVARSLAGGGSPQNRSESPPGVAATRD